MRQRTITAEQVGRVKELAMAGESVTAIAATIGISHSAVLDIVKGNRHEDVSNPPGWEHFIPRFNARSRITTAAVPTTSGKKKRWTPEQFCEWFFATTYPETARMLASRKR